MAKKRVDYSKLAKKYKTTPAKVRRVYARGLAAYASSGSRPGINPHAWAAARVRSTFTGGPAAKVDRDILTGRKFKGRRRSDGRPITKKKK